MIGTNKRGSPLDTETTVTPFNVWPMIPSATSFGVQAAQVVYKAGSLLVYKSLTHPAEHMTRRSEPWRS